MRKILLFACTLAVMAACNRDDIGGPAAPSQPPEVNNPAEETVPVRLRIKDRGITTKGTTPIASEAVPVNARLTVTTYAPTTGNQQSVNSYDLGSDSEIIVNVGNCGSALFTIESGDLKDGVFQTTLEGQKEHLYAKGELKLTWEEMQSQDTPFEVEISRLINKISIEKICVDWANSNYDSREFVIKQIYLSDVPRNYSSDYTNVNVKGYNSEFTGEKEEIKFYNFGGLDGLSITSSSDNKSYMAPVYRLDDQLLDEVNKTVSRTTPYTTPHIFYAYLSNSSKGIRISSVAPYANYISLYVAETTIVIYAELDGEPMYYKVPVLSAQAKSPTNTHIRIRQMTITGPGSSSPHKATAYENISFSLKDWIEDDRSESTNNL